jgi:hypothetical protein
VDSYLRNSHLSKDIKYLESLTASTGAGLAKLRDK